LVYPVARGSGPMLSSLVAILFLGERVTLMTRYRRFCLRLSSGADEATITEYWRLNRLELVGVTLLNPVFYTLVLTTMVVAPVSQVAPIREMSTLIGAFLGDRLFAEDDLGRRMIADSVILVGVAAVAHG
jgi:drug/metabolite transporter (DMT)-like permease